MVRDLSAPEIVKNLSEAYTKERYKLDAVTENNAFKFARAMSNAFHAPVGVCIEDLGPQRFALTAEEGFLDNHANYWRVPRIAGESDEALRIRIGQEKLVKWGVFTVDDTLDLLANLLQVDYSRFTWDENIDEAGNYEPALIAFHIDPAVFTSKGITDVAGAVAGLQAKMQLVMPVGVRVIVTSTGTAQWDDGVTKWDDGKTYS